MQVLIIVQHFIMYPAYCVGVVSMRVRELSRAPAGYRLTNELSRGYEESKADKNERSVLSTQSINVVVVWSKLKFVETVERFE